MKKLYQLSVIALICAAYTNNVTMTEQPKQETNPQQEFDRIIYDWSGTFAKVLSLAKEKHFKVANPETSMIKAIDAFLNDLDPHSSFLDPKTYQRMLESTSGEFFGIGIVIDNTRKPKDKFLTIINTTPDGPSDLAGIQAMDKMVEINGKPLEGMSTEEIISLLKGERNTIVQVKVLREGQSDLLNFDITRDVVKEQTSLSFHIKDHNIHYLSLTMFSDGAAQKIEEILKRAHEHQYKGLILDLRNNSGGLLTSAIDIAGLFLKNGSLTVITKDKTGSEIEKYYTKREPVAGSNMPIFILINNYTASAAEILAGALKIHSQANTDKNQTSPVFLIGSKTFGKGSVQEVIPVNNNCAVKITTCLYYLPNNTTIQGMGIEPDFVIEKTFPPTEQMEWFTKSYGREQAFENHIKVTEPSESEDTKNKEQNEKKDTKNNWLDKQKKMLQTDNQLRETITLINLLHTGNKFCPENTCNHHKAIEFLKENYITGSTLTMEEL